LKPYWRLLAGRSGRTYLIALTEGIFILGQFSYLGGFIEHTFHFNNLWIGIIMTAYGAAAIVGSRYSGRLAQRIGRQKVLMLGFGLTVAASAAFWALGSFLGVFVAGVAVMGLGTMLAHSTVLTMGTEFAASARGAATSLVAFCFMGGGGIGTAIGSKVVGTWGYPTLFLSFGIGLVFLVVLTRALMSHLENERPAA
jgi:predicted MFS family arabinose efflux permease